MLYAVLSTIRTGEALICFSFGFRYFLVPRFDHAFQLILHDREPPFRQAAVETFAVFKRLIGAFVESVLIAAVIAAFRASEHGILAGVSAFIAPACRDLFFLLGRQFIMALGVLVAASRPELVSAAHFRQKNHSFQNRSGVEYFSRIMYILSHFYMKIAT